MAGSHRVIAISCSSLLTDAVFMWCVCVCRVGGWNARARNYSLPRALDTVRARSDDMDLFSAYYPVVQPLLRPLLQDAPFSMVISPSHLWPLEVSACPLLLFLTFLLCRAVRKAEQKVRIALIDRLPIGRRELLRGVGDL